MSDTQWRPTARRCSKSGDMPTAYLWATPPDKSIEQSAWARHCAPRWHILSPWSICSATKEVRHKLSSQMLGHCRGGAAPQEGRPRLLLTFRLGELPEESDERLRLPPIRGRAEHLFRVG